MTIRLLIATLLATLFAIGLQTRAAKAQGAFIDATTTFTNGATAVAVADLDRDGDLDAWLGYEGDSRVYSWAENAWVDSGQRLGEEDFILDVVLGDFDGDGDIDAAALDFINLTIWINVGGKQARAEGIYEFRASFPINLGSRIGLGDLDNDNDLDLYVAHSVVSADTVWLNDGDANFSDSGLRLGNASSTDVALGDIDGDNDLDAIVSTATSSSLEPTPLNEIWLNTTNHVTATTELFIDSGKRLGDLSANTLTLGDVDDDSDLDVWLGRLTGSDLLWINQGGAQAGVEGEFVADAQNLGGPPREIVFADTDGDGDLDAVKVAAGVGVWLNQGGIQQGTPGQFAFRGQTIQTPAERIALGDFNGDQAVDLLVAPFANNNPTTYWVNGDAPAVEVYRGLRDDHMRNFQQGRHYISLYEEFTGEILLLMLTNPTLTASLWAGLDLWQPTIDALITGNGEETLISPQQVKAMDEVLDTLEEVGGASLKETIAAERVALGKPLDDFAGISISQASSELLGEAGYLLFVPTVHQSNIQSTALRSELGTAQWTVHPMQLELCFVLCLFLGCA